MYLNGLLGWCWKSFAHLCKKKFNILWEHLDKFEMNIMNINHGKSISKYCNQCFHCLMNSLMSLIWFENDIFVGGL